MNKTVFDRAIHYNFNNKISKAHAIALALLLIISVVFKIYQISQTEIKANAFL